MAGPFYNGIKGTTAGTPGVGAFTPNAASSGFLAWSTVPTGWIGLVRYEDGSTWELQYCYWNGTTLSRAATTQFVSSSSGSALTLTSAATAAMIVDAGRIGVHLSSPWRGHFASTNTSVLAALNTPTATVTGTAAAAAVAASTLISQQVRLTVSSVTTANGQAGVSRADIMGVTSSTAGFGGWEFVTRFSFASPAPTGQRFFVGMTSVNMIGNTGEPSALVASCAVLAKDSTDTNFQILTNDGTTGGTKINTGLAPLANDLLEIRIWSDPGSLVVRFLLINLTTGFIFYTTTSTDVPVTGSLLMPMCITGLSATTGTAAVLTFCSMLVRSGVL